MITAQIIADSINPDGQRLTSWILKYPRFIHSEFMTHRVFSRNAASSRAIPVKRMLMDVEDHPAEPEFWAANQSGMGAFEQLTGDDLTAAKAWWSMDRKSSLMAAQALSATGLHKGLANRVIEAHMHMTVLATATDVDNFFKLRANPMAMPEFQVLAYKMLDTYLKSNPVVKHWGEWHIPFGDRIPDFWSEAEKRQIAVARCARLSYATFDNSTDPGADLALYDKLRTSGHWSPFEHVAVASESHRDQGNFRGWTQMRKLMDPKDENPQLSRADLEKVMADKPDWIQL